MLLVAKRLYVNNPTKRQTKAGKQYWTFFTSLGMWNKGAKAKQSKGTLNCICFVPNIELKPKQCLTNAFIDLFVEIGKDNRTYFKAMLTKFDTEMKVEEQPDLVDVNTQFPVDAFNDDDFKIPDISEPIKEEEINKEEENLPKFEEL